MCDAEAVGTNESIGELSIRSTKKIAIRPSLVSFGAFFDRDIMASPNFISLLCLMGGCLSNPYGVVREKMGVKWLLANLDWVRIESPHHRVFAPIFQATKACLRTSVTLLQND